MTSERSYNVLYDFDEKSNFYINTPFDLNDAPQNQHSEIDMKSVSSSKLSTTSYPINERIILNMPSQPVKQKEDDSKNCFNFRNCLIGATAISLNICVYYYFTHPDELDRLIERLEHMNLHYKLLFVSSVVLIVYNIWVLMKKLLFENSLSKVYGKIINDIKTKYYLQGKLTTDESEIIDKYSNELGISYNNFEKSYLPEIKNLALNKNLIEIYDPTKTIINKPSSGLIDGLQTQKENYNIWVWNEDQ